MALTNWNDILNKPKGIDEVPEIALTVEQLSASVLSISEDVGEIAEDVQEIALEISQLSASTLPYSNEQNTKEKIEDITTQIGILQYVSYGNVTGVNNITEAFKKVFDSLNDGCFIVQFGYSGAHITVCYRYENGQFGMMFGVNYYAGNLYIANVASGNLTLTTK